ncbi:methyltransferase domain-containing protein, partial [Candidatus Woesearchaeota archaeon]|nr:methyltransferase domain-containing protein [Candidatus Woesearchaeota archaeon]
MTQKPELLKFWKDNFGFTDAELNAFREVNREDFIPQELRSAAYHDMPIMTHALELESGEKVFEVGTGSAYQAAIIARIVGARGKVITTEAVPELVSFAKQNLRKAGIKNVFVYEEDGSKGMPSEAPFDKIIITAACKEFPKPLIEQLKPNGMIVGPVGSQQEQEMVRGVKDKNGHLELEFLGQFLFTPMYGK